MSTVTFHQIAITPVLAGLKNARFVIQKGYDHSQAQKTDPNDLLTARLHPDMANLIYQVQRFTDTAKFLPERLNPKLEAISLPDEEKTFPELLARVDKTIAYLEALDPKALDGLENEQVVARFGPTAEFHFKGLEYAQQFAHPNFWFHVTTTYAILRAKGVDVGKKDFLFTVGVFNVAAPKPEEK